MASKIIVVIRLEISIPLGLKINTVFFQGNATAIKHLPVLVPSQMDGLG